MCLAIPPNSTRIQQYTLPPYWFPCQEATGNGNDSNFPTAAAAGEPTSSTATVQSSQCCGLIPPPFGKAGRNLSETVFSSAVPPALSATPPPFPLADSCGIDFGLSQIGLSPYILRDVSLNNYGIRQVVTDCAASTTPPLTEDAPSCHLMGDATPNPAYFPRRRRAPQRPGKTATQKERLFVQHNYHDLMNEPDVASEAASSSVSSSAVASVATSPPAFPMKLHCLLEEAEASGFGHIVSWQPHGRAFKIHNPALFTETIMQKYFPKMRKLSSLQRQFNLYGFERLTRDGSDTGAYYHEAFLRYRPGLCVGRMTRKRVKGTGYKAASNPDAEPNLYAYPFIVRSDDAPLGAVIATPKLAKTLPTRFFVDQRLSSSSINSDGTTDHSYYSTSTESKEESALFSDHRQEMIPMSSSHHQVSSSSWSNPSTVNNINSIQAPLKQTMCDMNVDTHDFTSASNDSFMDRYLKLSPSAQDLLLDDALEVKDCDCEDGAPLRSISSIDSFMDKYLSDGMTSLSRCESESSSRREPWSNGFVPSSTSATSFLQHDQFYRPVGRETAKTDFDVNGFMDRYITLPRATQDSILHDLLALNEGVNNDRSS